MSQDLMNYDKMTQLALRGVVRDAIRRVIREDGLPGAHHFYITFLTRFPGVEIDGTLAKKHGDEITIVIEHQYWDLNAHNDSFEVTLKFGGVPKYLSVPYMAITRFHDPSVRFSMHFDPPEEMQDKSETPPTLARLKPETAKKPKQVTPVKESTADKKPSKSKTKKTKQDAKDDGPDDQPPSGGSSSNENKVVSLDAFRKK